MIAAERLDLIDVVHMTPILTSTNAQIRTSASLLGRFVIARLNAFSMRSLRFFSTTFHLFLP